MGWENDTYVDGKNITQWEKYITDYNANPAKYPNGYIYDEQGNLFLMRENDMFDDMMDNFGLHAEPQFFCLRRQRKNKLPYGTRLYR